MKKITETNLKCRGTFQGNLRETDTTVPLKSKKGITLIALVITIIVLLILAGVTLSIVFNGGIINKSQTAVDKYTEESAKEKLSLAIFNYKMGKITGEAGEGKGQKTFDKYIEEIGGAITIEDATTYTIEVDGYEFIVGNKNYEITSNGPVTGESPEIRGRTFDLVGDEHLSAIIKVTASATKGGVLTVTIGGQEATLENGTYNLTVTNNGKYTITVAETGLTRKAIGTVEVIGIEKRKYTVTINKGTGIDSVTESRQVEEENSLDITATAQTGYVFSKWTITSGTGTIENATSASTKVTPTGNITIEATAGKQMSKVINGDNTGIDATNGTLNGKPATYKNPVIPAGFKTSTEGASWSLSADGTYVTGWDAGLVIEDSQRNQFVWVPAQIVGAGITNVVEYKKWCTTGTVHDDANITGDDLPSLPDGVTETTQIDTYGGFYIGRYEASESSNHIPQTQYNKSPWTSIEYNESKSSAELYKDDDWVKSGLLTGTMWDTALAWIDSDSRYNGYSTSESYGNHSGSEPANTGKKESDCVKNIYDLAGNVREWTGEIYYPNERMGRGGTFYTGCAPAYRVHYTGDRSSFIRF